jgi:plastocyanin
MINPEIIKPDFVPEGSIVVSNLDKGGSGKYEFSQSEFEFKVGDEVTFALTSETEFHTFTISELNIDVEIEAGQTEIFTFDFDKPGKYRIFCIPHESLGMVGEIIVE